MRRFAVICFGVASLMFGPPVRADEPAAAVKIDPSLVPGLKAQIKAAQDDQVSARDSMKTAETERDARQAESSRWKADVASVDKDKALYEAQYKDYAAQRTAINSQVDSHAARCPSVVKDEALAASCNAEAVAGNKTIADLDAWEARLNQMEADFKNRYDTIDKMLKPLNDRISELNYTYVANRFRYNRDAQTIEGLTEVLAGH